LSEYKKCGSSSGVNSEADRKARHRRKMAGDPIAGLGALSPAQALHKNLDELSALDVAQLLVRHRAFPARENADEACPL
jgi:hypothetical protein